MLGRITVLVLLLALPFGGALADTAEGVFCGDLDAADCQILMDNSALMHEIDSFHMDAQMSLSIAAGGSDDIQWTLAGSGDLAMDARAAEGIDDMAEQAEAVVASLAGRMQFVFTQQIMDESSSANIEMLMKDGVFLVNAGAMELVLGEAMDEMEWFGLDLNGAMGALLEQAGLSDAADSPADSENNGTTVTRLDDAEIGDATVAVFESIMDGDALMSADDDAVSAANAMLGMGMNIQIDAMLSRSFIGLDDGYTHRMEVAATVGIGGLDMDDMDMSGDWQITLAMRVDLSAFNQTVEVELPDDVPAFPLGMMLAMGEG